MAPRRRSSGQRSQPKLFRCTGHGDCNMVFTRSEHLLRHERKHTGEKPYKCVVPGCDRRFSRFDNMMQHTQTHNKRKAMNSKSIVQLKHEDEEPAYYHHSMVDTRTLPNPSEFSLSPLQEHCNVWSTRNETLPYHYHPTIEPGNWKRRPSVSTVSSSESSVISPISATFSHCHHEPEVRRLSINDLHLPIENFNDFHHKDKVNTMNHYNSINITSDEFEALQAFSKIRSGVSLAKYSPTTDYESPNFASQVCAMRQRVMTLNESYQRC